MLEYSGDRTQIPPNEKMWGEEERDAILARLPDYMALGDTTDIRVGQWFPVEIGGSIRIDKIPRERRAIIAAFDDLGVEVRVPLVGVSDEGNSLGMQAYKVEIENWVSEQQVERDNNE